MKLFLLSCLLHQAMDKKKIILRTRNCRILLTLNALSKMQKGVLLSSLAFNHTPQKQLTHIQGHGEDLPALLLPGEGLPAGGQALLEWVENSKPHS